MWTKIFLPVVILILVTQSLTAVAPPIGWTTPVKIVQVYDGDTVVVEITKRVRVRLLDCWAPEIRTKNADEKILGYASREHLSDILPEGSEAILHIPGHVYIGRAITFGRFLGHVWAGEEATANVSQQQVQAGHATVNKIKR
mgnify:CR=1 FL=1